MGGRKKRGVGREERDKRGKKARGEGKSGGVLAFGQEGETRRRRVRGVRGRGEGERGRDKKGEEEER